MAQTKEGQNRASQQQCLSIPMTNFSTDLLQRVVSRKHFSEKSQQEKSQLDPSEEEDPEEIELSLGLSLNGRFGVDPRAKNKLSLKRSSSIPDFTTNPTGYDVTCRHVPPAEFTAPLTRTCSLPTETEEEWRKRKELQSLRRMEAKRKRSEKQRNFKAARDRSRAPAEENGGEDDSLRSGVNGSRQNQEQSLKVVDEFSSMAVPAWVSSGVVEMNGEKDNGSVLINVLSVPTQPSFQGSTGSHGSGSPGISESNCLAGQGKPVSIHLNKVNQVQILISCIMFS